ncbi:uncharacterized protein LOC143207153 [Lasioglossum baleicum]|uniref:uncharacterized protein LOC143207153 n=1 Tax=Lasioglossum baleicum TaxID=434251 RepID=UPI003FCE928E
MHSHGQSRSTFVCSACAAEATARTVRQRGGTCAGGEASSRPRFWHHCLDPLLAVFNSISSVPQPWHHWLRPLIPMSMVKPIGGAPVCRNRMCFTIDTATASRTRSSATCATVYQLFQQSLERGGQTASHQVLFGTQPERVSPEWEGRETGDDIRKHNKGCGCLKNYCECYEAKIPCSANFKGIATWRSRI